MRERPRHLKIENDHQLFRELKILIDEKIASLPESRLNSLKIKLFIYPIFYCGIYALALSQIQNQILYYILFALMGLMVVVIFCELIHELSHNNIFKEAKYNQTALLLFDFLGANSYIWQKRHLKLHHVLPNVNGWDADIEQKGPVAIFPHEEGKKMMKYQHWYVFILYPLFMLNWLFVRDFRDFFSDKRIIRKVIEIPIIEYVKLFIFKSFNVFILVIVPVVFGGATVLQGIMGLFVLSVAGSILAMLVLLTPHINIDNEFPRVNDQGNIDTTWFRHQMITTNDIEYTNWLTRNLMGNFNYHVGHHLFPRISSVYAPEVTKVIKNFCIEKKLPYKSYPMGRAFKKHYQLIRKNAISMNDLEL